MRAPQTLPSVQTVQLFSQVPDGQVAQAALAMRLQGLKVLKYNFLKVF